MTELTPTLPGSEHSARWKWFLALGAALLGLGAIGVSFATLMQLTSFLVFGPLLLASSLFQGLTAFGAEKGKDRLLHYAAAVLEMLLGFFILAQPVSGMGSLIAWIAIFLIAGGLVRLARSFVTQAPGRGWTALAGGIALLLGVVVWIRWPVAELWLVGLCLAVDLLCHGISWSAVALADRKA
jgi:uncharacterized membrane protein HdeD (DUF308 family)